MTTVVLLADPPIAGAVYREIQATTPLDETETLALYEAMLGDVAAAIEGSSGDLLVNYRPREHLEVAETESPKSAIESVVADAVSAPDAVRYEVQVGSSYAARIGNTVTHLLEREDEASVHVVEPTVPTVTRQRIDSASMKLRRTPVVVAPADRGRVGYVGFTEALDFDEAFDAPAIESVVEQAIAADLEIDFVPHLTRVDTPSDLSTMIAEVRARARAGRKHPERTYAVIEDLGLRADETAEGTTVTRE